LDVLFPTKPTEDPFVRAGTYEIQATPSRVAFVVAEPDGSGLVLAALAPGAYRFDEFVRAAAWDPDALAPSWDGSDSEGVPLGHRAAHARRRLFQLRHRDIHVAPPVYAMQQDTGSSIRYTRRAPTALSSGSNRTCSKLLALCDPFFSPCIGDGPFHTAGGGARKRRRPRLPARSRCRCGDRPPQR